MFGNVETRKKSSWMICVFLILWRKRALFDEEKLRKVIVISELEKATLLEDISWRQKSMALS